MSESSTPKAGSPTESELKDLLGTLIRVCQHIGATFVEKGVPLPDLKDGDQDLSISAARKPIESLFSRVTSTRIAPTADFIELLDALMTANSRSADSSEDAFRADAARKAVEDYVARLEAECVMELLHEGTGNMLPVRVKTVVEVLQKENERLQQALHEAIEFDAQQVFEGSPQGQELIRARAELERLRLFETYVCGVIAMGTQADLTVEALPR